MSKRKPKVKSTPKNSSVVTPSISSASKGKQKKSRKHSPQLKRLKEAPPSSGRSGRRKMEEGKPVAKIPSSRADASGNWKALLNKQGKSLPDVVPAPAPVVRPIKGNVDPSKEATTKQVQKAMDSGGRSRSVSQARSSSQLSLVSESASSVGTDACDGGSDPNASLDSGASSRKVKQEFRALGLSQQKRQSRSSGKSPRGQLQISRFGPETPLKVGLPQGLNDFGFFDYSHYGALRTPITPAHGEYMIDTGIIAMDCEMVGVGPMRESALARVSIVNTHGFCLYNKFVKPKMEVTDYRTEFSGVRENDLKNACPMQQVVTEVAAFLRSHILVGHSLKSDLGVLFLNHPKARIRDTAYFFKKHLHIKMPKLKTLTKKILGVDIQQGEHSSIIDAQATMALYLLHQAQWEAQVRDSNRGVNVLKECLDEFKEVQLSKFNAAAPPPPPNLMPSPEPSTSQSQKNWYDDFPVDNNCNIDYQQPLPVANSSPCLTMSYPTEQMRFEYPPINCPPHSCISPVSFLQQPQDCPPFYSSMTPPPEPFCGHFPPQPEAYRQPCSNTVNIAVYQQQVPIQIPVQLPQVQVAMPVFSYGNYAGMGMGMPANQMQHFPFIPTPPPQRTVVLLMHPYKYMAV